MVFIFVDESGGLRPPHPPLSTKNCESHFRQLVFTWEQSAKVGYAKQHPQSMVQHFSIFITGRGLTVALNYVSIQPGSVVLDK